MTTPNQSFTFNAYQSNLAGPLLAGLTTVAIDFIPAGLGVPAYLVIDPDVPASREYIKVLSYTGNTIDSMERNLEGSAGDVDHLVGAVIRAVYTMQALDDTFLDIETNTTALASHASDLGDPHAAAGYIKTVEADAAYLRLDGTSPMAAAIDMANNLISQLATPIADDDAATKIYIDTHIENNFPHIVQYATIADRTSQNPTPGDGEVAYMAAEGSDPERVVFFDGTLWVGLSRSKSSDTAFIATEETRAPVAYGNMATTGPLVTFDGPAGVVRVTVTAELWSDTVNGIARMGFELQGVTVLAASDDRCLSQQSAGNNTRMQASGSYLVDVNAGLTTFIARYSNASGTNAVFRRRTISVEAI